MSELHCITGELCSTRQGCSCSGCKEYRYRQRSDESDTVQIRDRAGRLVFDRGNLVNQEGIAVCSLCGSRLSREGYCVNCTDPL